eukprot:SAG11_NODE_24890_length_366_cov_1.400749_1_plen_32_part_10
MAVVEAPATAAVPEELWRFGIIKEKLYDTIGK